MLYALLPSPCKYKCRTTMSAHLVETSEEDSFLAVARFIGDLLNEGQVSRQQHQCSAFLA